MRLGILLIVVTALGLGPACSHVVVRGTEQQLTPFSKVFKGSRETVWGAAKQALTDEGYKILEDRPAEGILETGWIPAKAASHYVDLFGRRDYATVGAYYKLYVLVSPEDDGQEVAVRGIANSTISNLKSSGAEEEKILRRIANLLRSPSIEITNVGITEQ